MLNNVLEAKLPDTFQLEVTEKVCSLLQHHYCINLVGMKRVGINSYLRFFLSHPQLINRQDNSTYLCIMVDLNDLVERELYPFWILTQKRIADTVEDSELPAEIKGQLQTLFLNSIQTKELFLVIDNIRTSLIKLNQAHIFPVIVFNRFDRLEKVLTSDLFCNLEGLRDATNKKVSYLFTTFRALDEWSPKLDRPLSLSLMLDVVYVKPLKEEDAQVAFKRYIKPYHIRISKALTDEILALSGGSIQYIRLSTLALANKQQIIKSGSTDILKRDERITLHSEEIWESLTANEQKTVLKIAQGQTCTKAEKKDSRYIWDTGIVTKNLLFSPFFEQHVQSHIKAEPTENGNAEFSKKELLLFTLLKDNLDKVMDRGEIIESVWPEEEEFGVSDWAIDRLVSRVRSKLKKQNSEFELITVKTRGYKLTLRSL